MSTGPQIYPGANHTSYWYQSKWGGDAMEVNVVVWHSTEGTSVPTYSGGSEAPNLTVAPDFRNKKLVWYQHFNIDTSSRALVNLSGGVETNTLNVVQVEVVGTCDPKTHASWAAKGIQHLYMADLPDWAIRDLAAFAKWLKDNHNVPLTEQVTFKAYPDSYGTSNGVRMSSSKWNSYRGHCGHQHVPENLHGDPGAFPMGAILAKASGTTPINNQEDDMALTDADAKKIALAIWSYSHGDKPDVHQTLATAASQATAAASAAKAIKPQALSDDQIAKIAESVANYPGLADKIADTIAARLKD